MYRLAELAYQRSEFAIAERLSGWACLLAPQHVPAQALWREVRFVRGDPSVTAQPSAYAGLLEKPRYPDLILEAQSSFLLGACLSEAGSREEARREFRKVVEFAKWLPASPELEDVRRRAEEGLGELR